VEKENPYEIIATRRNSKLASKEATYKLLADSYKGGIDYINATPSHLIPYDREYKAAFERRKERSVYINFLQPIVDLLSGFVFKEEPDRKIPPDMQYIVDKASKRKGLNQFMQALCPQAIMMTMGVLVDSPRFDPKIYETEADRIAAKLQPYACMYYPWHIRDFACDAEMNIEWVLLDDSRTIKTDPLKGEEHKKIYRLWTKATYQDFEIKEAKQGEKPKVEAGEVYAHNLGEVPFHFVNVRDVEDDHVCDSPMEDIGILSRMIYNIMSYLDEMLASGTFKTLFYPTITKEDIPPEIKKKGVSDSPVATFNGAASHVPFFAGAGLESINPFIDSFNLYKLQIFSKIGMDVDRDKTYVQSGSAIGQEFKKTEALLIGISEAMEEAEEFIIRVAALWEGKKIDPEVEYTDDYQQADVAAEFARLKTAYDMAQPDVSRLALEGLVKILFPNLSADEAKKISDGDWKRNPVEPPLTNPFKGAPGRVETPQEVTE